MAYFLVLTRSVGPGRCLSVFTGFILVMSFKCRFSVTIKESLMNKESVTDVLLIMSRMKHICHRLFVHKGLLDCNAESALETKSPL